MLDGLHREARGHLAGGVSSHPIGDDEQRQLVIRQEAVLVVRSYRTGFRITGRVDHPQTSIERGPASDRRACRASLASSDSCPASRATSTTPGQAILTRKTGFILHESSWSKWLVGQLKR